MLYTMFNEGSGNEAHEDQTPYCFEPCSQLKVGGETRRTNQGPWGVWAFVGHFSSVIMTDIH